MHTTSSLYKQLLLRPNHLKEVKLIIANTEYSKEDIVSISVSNNLYREFGVGNAPAGQIDVQFYPKGSIPRQSQIQVFVRLVEGSQYSEWIPKGVFFFSTRETDRSTGVMTVHGYDSMLKAEDVWLNSSYDTEDWPMPVVTAVNDIAGRMGIQVDSRTQLNTAFPVQYPVNSYGDMTMREVLKRIAAINAGNWIISDEGKLLLVKLNQSTGSALEVGTQIETLAPGITSLPIGEVEILDESGSLLAKAVSETVSNGKVLTVVNPDGTQAMASYILSQVNGYTQRAFEGVNALLDPAAELGDAISSSELEFIIASMSYTIDGEYWADISAPSADEVDDEYPYTTREQRLERNLAEAYSRISKTSESISLLVNGLAPRWLPNTRYSLHSVVSYQNKFYDCTTAHTSGNTFDPSKWTEISNGAIQTILDLAVGKMTLSVSSDTQGSSITLRSGDIQIVSAAVLFQTDETHFTGSLSASKINTGTLNADEISVKDAFAVLMYNSNTGEYDVVGFVGAATGNDGQSDTKGAVLKSANGNSYAIVTNAGVRLQRGNTSFWLQNDDIKYRIAGGDAVSIGYAVFS